MPAATALVNVRAAHHLCSMRYPSIPFRHTDTTTRCNSGQSFGTRFVNAAKVAGRYGLASTIFTTGVVAATVPDKRVVPIRPDPAREFKIEYRTDRSFDFEGLDFPGSAGATMIAGLTRVASGEDSASATSSFGIIRV